MIVLWYTKSPMNEEVHGRGNYLTDEIDKSKDAK